ncbi:MAG: helix-turn-helix domain-containing protein [Candidatus Limnocylindrales bacterium]
MSGLRMRESATEPVVRRGRESSRSETATDRPTLLAMRPSKEPGAMSDRLRTAVNELVAVLRDEIASEVGARERAPDRLLSIEEAARALGVGRTALYSEIGAGRIRSIKLGRRRLVPSSAIRDIASSREITRV